MVPFSSALSLLFLYLREYICLWWKLRLCEPVPYFHWENCQSTGSSNHGYLTEILGPSGFLVMCP